MAIHPHPLDADLLHGIWRIIPNASLTEIIAQSGFNFQILDREHGAYDYDTLQADITACDARGCAPIVRVSGKDNVEVQRCLDLGAHGLVFPQLSTPEEFARASAMMDHAPVGTRGFNPFVRAYGYGSEVVEETKRPWFIPIIETLSAVEALDEILQNPRIDLIYIGSYDLSAQLGCPGQMSDSKMVDVTNRIIAAADQAKVGTGLMALTPDLVAQWQSRDVRAIVHGVESHRTLQAFSGIIEASSDS